MKLMTSVEVRQAFLDFFEEHGHRKISSSSLVPGNDPTLLFANSGMVQFKDVFLGTDKRDYTRATTAQKCMRVSGKHNDLENVGPSPRHHTFFEMLGNFSFGDYFKKEAIEYAWQLLTQVYSLPAERLAVTVYEKDDESYKLWNEMIGIPADRIARMGPKDNFWQMAETGPCGPNSEIYWDRYPERGQEGVIASIQEDDGRFMEIWNLVFMQFNRTQPDPTHSGDYDLPLPSPGVDTGMGLERMCVVMQEVYANYETDLFTAIIAATQALTGHSDAERDANIVPYRVIADHLRAAVFLIADGVLPGAKGRDSVCRLVLRRAARFGEKLGFREPFMGKVADTVIEVMGTHYTELIDRASAIKKVITQEEERFRRTMDRGLTELDVMLTALPAGSALDGEKAFYLKATLGLPIQVTKDIAEERGYTVEMAGFETAEQEHATVSGGGQAMGHIASVEEYTVLLNELQAAGALGSSGVVYRPYDLTRFTATIVALLQNGQPVQSAITGEKVEIVLDTTGFYVESGGQVSDTGVLSGAGWRVEVEDMNRPISGLIVHIGEVVEGTPQVGDRIQGEVTAERRASITRNHTATHLLHAALRNHLGTHVQQRGSLVAPDRLRFDFVHDAKVTGEELKAIEQEVNAIILHNYPVIAAEKSLAEAKAEGAMALFGEKYGERVRTVIIAQDGERYSYELCGGVHVAQTAAIGTFMIVSEGSVSAGVRRVEALTGPGALAYNQQALDTLANAAEQLNTTPENVPARLAALQDELAASRKQIEKLRRDIARSSFDTMINQLEPINGVPTLIALLADTSMDTLREMSDWFRGKVKSGVFVAGSDNDGKPQLMVAVTDDLTKKGLHAGNMIKSIAPIVGGGGGGKPNMAQAGGKDSGKLREALEKAREIIAESYQA